MGVRVVPELEQPGHFSAYGLGLPDLDLTIATGSSVSFLSGDVSYFVSDKHMESTFCSYDL